MTSPTPGRPTATPQDLRPGADPFDPLDPADPTLRRDPVPSGGEPTMSLVAIVDQQRADTERGLTIPCREEDPEIWFAETPGGVEFAKALCQTCPLQAVCLDGALERREPWGVWGGELFEAGRVIPRKRPRGRPRKHPVPA